MLIEERRVNVHGWGQWLCETTAIQLWFYEITCIEVLIADTCIRLYFAQLCVITVHLRESELEKAEEQLKKMTSSTEAKIDKLVLFQGVVDNSISIITSLL